MAKNKSRGERNAERKCGKAWKKHRRKNKSTGRTIGGYTPAKLAIRAMKRATRDDNNRATVRGSS